MRVLYLAVIMLALSITTTGALARGPFRRPCPAPAPAQAIGPFWQMDLRVHEFSHINVDLPGRGIKKVWYLRYEVTNPTATARDISPFLTLGSGAKPAPDEILISAEAALRRRDDPQGRVPLLNSIALAKVSIGPGQTVHAVAFWEGVEPGPRATVQVRGLSNGFIDARETIYYKTLRLSMASDGAKKASGEWIYLAQTGR
ncbi:MAG: hypothetical protein HY289_05565 [Planctomycetes bacterium]|nr:hypothetical protein [Planctomycetota bacterium]